MKEEGIEQRGDLLSDDVPHGTARPPLAAWRDCTTSARSPQLDRGRECFGRDYPTRFDRWRPRELVQIAPVLRGATSHPVPPGASFE